MSAESRNDLIDAYFSALDKANPILAADALADLFVYESLSGDLEGYSGLEAYITDLRSVTESDHQIEYRHHADGASTVQGVVTGTDPDGNQVEVSFCDVFRFDDNEAAITRISVYVNNG